MQDQRLALLKEWLGQQFSNQHFTLQPVIGDASFRRYFRVQINAQSYIAMDAPPPEEDCRPFVAIAQAFAELGVQVPHIFAADITKGFLLLTDFGDALYINELTSDNFSQLYSSALNDVIKIQACREVKNWDLPYFNGEFILREWHLFYDWLLLQHCNATLNLHEQHQLTDVFNLLNNTAHKQPQVCVHRDYHSRNLLRLADDKVGILDFQDAVWGPLTYDAVSLLRDCYIDWPPAAIEKIIILFFEQLREEAAYKKLNAEEFIYWFDLMGIQRNLKALGIFARLKYKFGKPNYLQYIPRGLTYVLQVSERYPELANLRHIIQRYILPHFVEKTFA